jgi:hypothetical protein
MEPSLTINPRPVPRLGFALLVGMIALVAVGKAVLADTLDPDAFWHLRVGQEIAQMGWPRPLVDDLSFASTRQPWTPYSWLAELAMKRLWDAGGYRAAVAAQAAMEAAFLVLLALAALEASESATGRPRYLAAALGAAAGAIWSLAYLSFRPVTAALTILALIAWLLLRDRRMEQKSRAVWLVPPLVAILVNVHFFALLVPLWTGALWVGDVIDNRLRAAHRRTGRDLLLTVLCAAACTLTPLLGGTLRAVFNYSFHDVLVRSAVIVEMQPFYAGTMGHISAALAILLAVLTFWRILRPRDVRLGTGELIWLAGSAILLLRLGRMAPVFAIIAAPMLAATLPNLSQRVLGRAAVMAAIALILVMGTWRIARAYPPASLPISTWLNRNGPEAAGYPCAAADFVQRHVPPRTGRIICEFPWGGYLEWRLGDHFTLLMDGRTQLFPADFWKSTYLGSNQDRQRLIRAAAADAAIIPVHHSLFAADLIALHWTTAYRDDRAAVMVPP